MPQHAFPSEVRGAATIPLRTRQEIEAEIARRLEVERARLAQQNGLARGPATHFHRPVERPFTEADRDRTTILLGGLTTKHDRLLKAVFESSGYTVQLLPTPDVAGFQLGKEFGNNGQCNPTYFMTGHLIKYLQQLESRGLSRQEIVDGYVFVTAGSCGPCRFGMYEAEYRLAVQNAGFDGFRVLVIQQNEGVNADTPAPGLVLNTDFRLRTLKAIDVGDVLTELGHAIRPFEVQTGETDRVFDAVTHDLSAFMADRDSFDVERRAPAWISRRLADRPGLTALVNALGLFHQHFYSRRAIDALRAAHERLDAIEVDRLRVKPVVKITGEFFAQTTEGDGNFNMFRFLEQEGAQVIVEPVANWIRYLLWCGKAEHERYRDVDAPPAWQVHRRLARDLRFRWGRVQFALGDRIFAGQYARLVKALGDVAHPLLDMDELARVASPYYNQFARGGEGHLEVAKNIYYTVHKKAHMVLSLKPFGCMPSSQSDGVQSAVMSHFKDMIFLPIETSGEGEINAHSRVQMALGEARSKARSEFQQAIASTGKSPDELSAFVADHPELRRALYKIPEKHGVTGTAATFALHVADLIDRRRRQRVAGPQRSYAAADA